MIHTEIQIAMTEIIYLGNQLGWRRLRRQQKIWYLVSDISDILCPIYCVPFCLASSLSRRRKEIFAQGFERNPAMIDWNHQEVSRGATPKGHWHWIFWAILSVGLGQSSYLCEKVSTFCDSWGASLEELKVVSCQYEVSFLPPEHISGLYSW